MMADEWFLRIPKAISGKYRVLMSKGTQILTKRLALMPYLNPDEKLVRIHKGWMDDPEVVRYSEHRHNPPSRQRNIRYINSFDHQTSFLWAILDKRVTAHHNTPWEDYYIGHLAAYGDTPNKSFDLAIVIGERSVWGKGYGLEAWQGGLDWLLAEGARKVSAGTMAANVGMMRIFEKSGMQLEGRRKDHFLLEGAPVDLVQVARFK